MNGLAENVTASVAPLSAWQVLGNLEIADVLRDYVASNPQREQICLFLSAWLGISKLTQVPGFNVAYAKKYCKASDTLLECEEWEKRFQASRSNFGDNELLRIESGDGAWYCTNCKASTFLIPSLMNR